MLKETLKHLETSMRELTDINTALDESLIVAVTNQRGMITFVNDKFCEISKYSTYELLGQNHRIINSGYHTKEFFRQMWRTIAHGQIWRGEIRNMAKDGTLYWVDTTIVPCLNEKGKPYQYISFRIDVTDRKRSEEFLRRSDKIEAFAQFASGIAHEIRNPLEAIRMTLHLLDSTSAKDPQFIERMLSELDRVDSIVNEFMMLAKPHEVEFREGDIRKLLETVVWFMRIQSSRRHVQIHLQCSQELPHIRCDENQLKQVFMNVIKNAMEAMPSGGDVEVNVWAEGKQLFITCRDHGNGIPAEQMSRIGEPFFTTKETGTGLGLIITQKIIQDHQGTMRVTSTYNQGTVVEIVLPVATES